MPTVYDTVKPFGVAVVIRLNMYMTMRGVLSPRLDCHFGGKGLFETRAQARNELLSLILSVASSGLKGPVVRFNLRLDRPIYLIRSGCS